MSIIVLQSSWWARESWLLCLVCLPGVSWLLCGSFSRCHGFVCSLWLWYFQIMLTYYFWHHLRSEFSLSAKRKFGFLVTLSQRAQQRLWSNWVDVSEYWSDWVMIRVFALRMLILLAVIRHSTAQKAILPRTEIEIGPLKWCENCCKPFSWLSGNKAKISNKLHVALEYFFINSEVIIEPGS